MSYKNYKYTVLARDYNSPYLRNDVWMRSFYKYPEAIGIPKVAVGMTARNNHIEYLVDMDEWTKAHELLKQKALADYRSVARLIESANEHGEKMNAWTEKNIFQADLKALSGQELMDLYQKFRDMQAMEYAYGTAIPVLDFGGLSFVEDNLNKIIKAKVSDQEYQACYAVFTEPSHDSFALQQEKDLLNLMIKYYGQTGWIDDVKNKDWDQLKAIYPDFAADLAKHAAKHAWVYYVYMGPAFMEREFLGFIKEYLKQGINPSVKLQSIEKHQAEVTEKKQAYIKQWKPDEFQLAILNLAGDFVWGKPRRKDYQSKSYYHVEKLMREIAKRLGIALEQARSAPIEVLEQGLINGQPVDVNLVNSIRKLHVLLANDDGTISLLLGQEAEEFSKSIKREEGELDLKNLKELRGVCACPGKAKGIVRIINIPEDMSKMNEGDILVSTATTPSIVPAMKQAGAIITDEGGLTCHASIVSRELQIPCVIGTKIATKALKDGDSVEVDAEKGLVTIK